MKYFLIVLTVAVYGNSSHAQTAGDSVKAVINRMFTGMKNADTNMLASCFAEHSILQTIIDSPDGSTQVKTDSVADFVASVGKLPAGDADERISFETVKTDGSLAIAWTPYQFFYKGKFSHCGVDSWQLVRTKGEWKIQYLIDTRRKNGCSTDN